MTESTPKQRFIRLDEVIYRTGLKKSTIYERMKANQFPQKIDLSPNNVGWLESEIDSWIAERINQSKA